MSVPSPQAIALALAAYSPVEVPALPGRTNHLRAGVLVPLVWDPRPTVLLTLRAPTIRHGGEVSFPGGRPEPQDASLEATALREAREELGIGAARVLGRLSSMPVYTSDHRLEPFVAELDADEPLSASDAEVARVLRVELAALLARQHIDALSWHDDGFEHLSPVFCVDTPEDGELAVYGATAHTLWELLGVVAPLFQSGLPELRAGRFEWRDLVAHRARAAQVRPPR